MSQQPSQLRNARVVTLDHVIERANVYIEGGRIARLVPAEDGGPTGTASADLKGLTLFPGFIDVHIHGAVGFDTLAASADELCTVSQYLLKQGVTGWLPTLVPASPEDYQHALESIAAAAQADRSGSRILGVHYEGPFVNSLQCGALHQEFFRTFKSADDLLDLPTLKFAGACHMMTLAPEVDGGIALIQELTKRRWTTSIGHTRAAADVLDQAWAAGARHMTHFMNAMPQLHHRKLGPVSWGLGRADVSCDVIADSIHLDPAILKLLVKIKTPQQLMLISDAIAAAGAGDGDYQIWGETISVVNGRTSNAHGSIAGSVISMLNAVRTMRKLGVAEADIARMAATNPARLLGIDHDCGSIEEGKRADLVALDAGGNVRLAMVNGQGLWS